MVQVRSYRTLMRRKGLVSFTVRHKETDLFIQAPGDFSRQVSAWVVEARGAIEEYARFHPGFIESYVPLPTDPLAPAIVKRMLEAGDAAGVGPMAAVAGAISEYVGSRIASLCQGEVMVENGGDIFLRILSPVTVSIYAGKSPLSGKVGVRLTPGKGPVSVCTSSGTLGHSRSFGQADAVTVTGCDCALSDAAATSAANLIQSRRDIARALEFLKGIKGISGAVVIKADAIGAFGDLELVPL